MSARLWCSSGIRPLMSPCQPAEVSPNAKSRVQTRSIQPLRIDGKLQKWIGATNASASAATLAC